MPNKSISVIEDDITPPWVVNRVNINVPVSCITIFDDGKQFIGTNNGNIYRSVNNGKSWDKVGTLKYSVPVTCFLRYPYIDGYAERILYFAGSERGVYKSEDGGSSWQESLSGEGVNGEWTKINYGTLSYDSNSKLYSLWLYGYNGKHNEFYYSQENKNWGPRISNYATSDYEAIDYDSWNGTFTDGQVFRDTRNNTSKIIFNTRVGSFNIYDLNKKVNSIKLLLTNYNKGFLGALDGFYVTSDAGKTWYQRSMQDTIISTLVIKDGGDIFAGTEKGLFFTKDEGKTWSKFLISVSDEPIIKLYSKKDYIYTITDKGEVYYFRVTKNSIPILMSPVLLWPKNNSIIDNNIILKWYGWAENEKGSYNLQISGSPKFENDIIFDESVFSMSYELKGLESGKTYYWRVRSMNMNGMTSWSGIFSFTVK